MWGTLNGNPEGEVFLPGIFLLFSGLVVSRLLIQAGREIWKSVKIGS